MIATLLRMKTRRQHNIKGSGINSSVQYKYPYKYHESLPFIINTINAIQNQNKDKNKDKNQDKNQEMPKTLKEYIERNTSIKIAKKQQREIISP